LQCENQNCPFKTTLRKFLQRRHNEGVFLQGRWYCSLDCFEHGITPVFAELIKHHDEPLPRQHRIPLGLMLLGRGAINESQLKTALQVQRTEGTERLGHWLVRLGVVSDQDVSAALAAQWGCAVFPLEHDRRYRECSHMLPLALLESSRMLALHYLPANQWLYLGFSENIDHTAIYSIERLLSSRTQPCVVSESAMKQAMDEIRGMSHPREIVFETLRTAAEMARTIRDYAVNLDAQELLLARPRHFLWARLKASGHAWDLMFRLPPASRAANTA
jgi:Type II secretion system (T2SS), protein E, N-terminal domain